MKGLRDEMRDRGVSEELLLKPLPRIRFHDLRHGNATLLLGQGVHPRSCKSGWDIRLSP